MNYMDDDIEPDYDAEDIKAGTLLDQDEGGGEDLLQFIPKRTKFFRSLEEREAKSGKKSTPATPGALMGVGAADHGEDESDDGRTRGEEEEDEDELLSALKREAEEENGDAASQRKKSEWADQEEIIRREKQRQKARSRFEGEDGEEEEESEEESTDNEDDEDTRREKNPAEPRPKQNILPAEQPKRIPRKSASPSSTPLDIITEEEFVSVLRHNQPIEMEALLSFFKSRLGKGDNRDRIRTYFKTHVKKNKGKLVLKQ